VGGLAPGPRVAPARLADGFAPGRRRRS